MRKGKTGPCHDMETYRRTIPRIPHLGLAAIPLKQPAHSWNRRLGGFQSWTGRFWGRVNL
jgi:hypothetical protein